MSAYSSNFNVSRPQMQLGVSDMQTLNDHGRAIGRRFKSNHELDQAVIAKIAFDVNELSHRMAAGAKKFAEKNPDWKPSFPKVRRG